MQFLKKTFSLRLFSIIILISGTVLRLREYFTGRSLWIDEARLALNLVNRDFTGLLQPLDFDQGAPIGFLWTEKLFITILGNQDYILRIFPLIAGIAALFLFHWIARELLGKYAIIAVAFFAFSERLIYYSAEVKQYSTDVFFCLVIFLAFLLWKNNNTSQKWSLFYGLFGLAAVWFSHPAAFLLAATWLTLAIKALINKDREIARALVIFGFAWAASFAVTYILSLRQLSSNSVMMTYWETGFAPFFPWENPGWYVQTAEHFMSKLLRIQPIAGMIAITFGLFGLARKQRAATFSILGMLGLTLLASSLRLYAFIDRLMLFSIPFLYLLIGESFRMLNTGLKRINFPFASAAAALALIYLSIAPFSQSIDKFLHPPMYEHIKPILSELSNNLQEEDLVYVYYGAIPAVQYYAPFYSLDENKLYFGISSRDNPSRYLDEIAHLPESPRTWFVFSHLCPNCEVDEQEYIMAYVDDRGTRIAAYEASRADGYLYIITPSP